MKTARQKARVSQRARLLAERDWIARKLNQRGHVTKALTDNDPFMVFVLLAVGAIWAVELIANVSTPTGWSGWVHLVLVGSLECAVIYTLLSAARAAIYRRKLAAIDRRLRQMTPI